MTGQDDAAFVRLKTNEEAEQALSRLADRVRGRNLVYLDFPLHYNIGDLFILLGAMQMLAREAARIKLFATYHSQSVGKLAKILAKDDLIVFHGGGNFGDIYPAFHLERLKVVERFPNHEIIFFPQTVDFNTQEHFELTRRAFSGARDLTLFVRDHQSLEHGGRLTPNCQLCPDTAHFLSLPAHSAANGKTLLFRRRDPESASTTSGFDWSEIVDKGDRRLLLLLKVLSKGARSLPGTLVERRIFDTWLDRCRVMLARAAAKFDTYEFLDADRLHAVILASLMQMPLRHEDTLYGKIGRYREAWLEQA